MKYKRSLTLIEIVIVMVLLGFLLTGLFNVFYQAIKKNTEGKQLKQTLLQLELFEHKVKHLLIRTKKIYTASHDEAQGSAFVLQFQPEIDSDWDRTGETEGMFYLNKESQLCFVSWSIRGVPRIEVLLEKVDQFSLRFFDAKKKEWKTQWPFKTEGSLALLSVTLKWKGKEIPFTFFPLDTKEQISYYGVP